MQPEETEVLIVGAGPTGLALAATLAAAGVPHVLVEKRRTPLGTSRAAVIHAHTLEVLERLGVSDRLVAEGLTITDFAIRDRDRRLFSLDFSKVGSRYNNLLMIPQERTEAILTARLEALGGKVLRGVEAASIENGHLRARAALREGDRTRHIVARWIVGADGMHSTVREAAGIGFDGESYPQSFVLADVLLDWPLGAREVNLFFAPEGLVVVAPLPGGRHRIVATVDEAREDPDAATIADLLAARGPSSARVGVRDVTWASRFRVHHRLAVSYHRERLILMGDAAHVHSPAGGQGMNTGLVDAAVLGAALADIHAGRRGDEAIGLYAAIRRPAAAEVLTLAHRLTRAATLKAPAARALRNAGVAGLDRLPGVKRRMLAGFSGVARRSMGVLPPGTGAAGADRPVSEAA